jgi:hypothetical protein
MNTSEQINELATALSKAQSQMTGAKKSAKNPFFKSNYSDLASVCEAISEPFSDNGLSYIQSPEFNENYITVVTRIMHSSGQWIEGTVQLPPTKNDAQGYGSAITYGRRYGLQAMAGVPSVDDDGQDAVKHGKPVKKQANQDNIGHKTKMIGECQTIEQLATVWDTLNPIEKNELSDFKDEVKARLSK